jgi:hypothetical protein
MPDTFNVLLIVVALFNIVLPDTFNVDKNVEFVGGFKIAL